MITDKASYKYYRKSDLAAYEIEHITPMIYWRLDHLRFQLRLRKLEYLSNVYGNNLFIRFYRLWLEILNHRLGVRLGFSIPKNVFGPGLCIVHYGTISVSNKAKVGKNCRIHPSTCIGDYWGAPHIGNNVYIGPGAKLFGDITVGNNVAVGANAVVNKDISDNVSIGGIPATIISHKGALETGVFPEKFIKEYK